MKKLFLVLGLSLLLVTNGFCAWHPELPVDNSKLKDTPALIRANNDAIALGTDSALQITNDKCSATMGLVDTKLATISTPGKVSGTAIIGLTSVPSGAGALPILNGGTGQTTSTAGLTALLPTQTGLSGRALVTNGTVQSWGYPVDLTITSQAQGDLLYFNGTNWIRLGAGTSGYILKTQGAGANPTWTTDGSVLTGLVATNLATGTVPTARLGSGTANNTSYLRGDQSWQVINTTPGAGTITSAMLKTTTGEVNVSDSSSMTWVYANLVLPGGEYGFYPQIKCIPYPSRSVWGKASIYNLTGSDVSPGETYVTYISLGTKQDAASLHYTYAQQRYVTASGEDLWIFLLLDKITKEIISAYQAPDHPAYGNGGDFDKVPHPFGSYDEAKHEIVLVDKDTCFALKAESKQTGKSILTLINEEYKPKMDKEEIYQPLHSGKYLTEDNKQIKQMVNTIPNYIKVRKLIKK